VGAGQSRRIRFNTATSLSIATPWETIPDPTSTYTVVNEADGLLSVDGESGDDTVDAMLSTLPVVIFGNTGSDTISGGDGEDIILGDRGRVDYIDEQGAIVTRLGTTPPVITGATTSATATTITDSSASFPVLDGGLIGLFVRITDGRGALQRRRIVGNTATELSLDAPWDVLPDTTSQYRISTTPENQTDGVLHAPSLILSLDPLLGNGDLIDGRGGEDKIIGGTAGDTVSGGSENDLIFGDHARIVPSQPFCVGIISIHTGAADGAGDDVVHGNTGDDVILGQQGIDQLFGDEDNDDMFGGHNVAGGVDAGDMIDGGPGHDALAGDNACIVRRNDSLSPLVRVLVGSTLYDFAGSPAVTATSQPDPLGRPGRDVTLLDHTPTTSAELFGSDQMAGGADHDLMWGQLGNDTMQGDGSVLIAVSAALPSVEAASDGDDYVEGNGGSDLLFGNLGQDDLLGGNSNLFGLTSSADRMDGSDTIFGGAGTRIGRNVFVGSNFGTVDDDAAIPLSQRHARDADVIAGDNANIYRIVGTNSTDTGGFLQFEYDKSSSFESRGARRVIPRTVKFLDYTPGGPSFDPAANSDIGGADEAHAESGDDVVYGMTGNDILFGDSDDDDLIAGWGHDWISAGTGQDGVLGDDGRIFTSRNGLSFGEPLYGVAAIPTSLLDLFISTPGKLQQATINVSGALKKTVDLTPFNLTPNGLSEDPLYDPILADDVIYAGLGSDWVHGGAGDDAISGAEAQASFFATPANPGDVLRFNPAMEQFADYDEFDPLRRIDPYFLNFNAGEGPSVSVTGYPTVHTDGNDVLFGDLGNDWMVGGTGQDHMYGGWGNDLLNADDDLGTNSGANNSPDTHPSYEDIAFGGAGRDVLIGNTGGDRLIDWVGEFNSYLVPFAPFGQATVSRTVQPQLFQYLYDLSKSDGADATRAADTGNDALRNGEPDGELGLITQKDSAWQAQTGPPNDPQAGNTPGGKRDVLRSADFNSGSMSGFAPDSGVWSVSSGALQVSATSPHADAVAVFHVPQYLPTYFEVQQSLKAIKPTGGWNANAYIIFDYQSPTDFKFAGLNVSLNKFQMGHRTPTAWVVDAQSNVKAKADVYYNLLVAVNGTNVTLLLDNTKLFSYTFPPRIIDGVTVGLNWGLVGVGSNNSRGVFDNVFVQKLPPANTFQNTEDFSDGAANLLTGTKTGTWHVQSSRYAGTPDAEADWAISLMDLGLGRGLQPNSVLDLSATVNTQTIGGLIFDAYGTGEFKYVAINPGTDLVIIGHRTDRRGWVQDAVASRVINVGTDYTLAVSLRGSSISVSLDGQLALSYGFNAVTVDGGFGLITRNGVSTFDNITVSTNDPGFQSQSLVSEPAHGGTGSQVPLTDAALEPIVTEAIRRWTVALGSNDYRVAALSQLNVAVADLPDRTLGQAQGNQVIIDTTAGTFGWFVDVTPRDDREFSLRIADTEFRAIDSSPAAGRMDLLTVVMHELGHVLGLEHAGAHEVMGAELLAGQRKVPYESVPSVRDRMLARRSSAAAINCVFEHSLAGFDSSGPLGARANLDVLIENVAQDVANSTHGDPTQSVDQGVADRSARRGSGHGRPRSHASRRNR
jgi:Ca2+-binding RTX toxin-like protein